MKNNKLAYMSLRAWCKWLLLMLKFSSKQEKKTWKWIIYLNAFDIFRKCRHGISKKDMFIFCILFSLYGEGKKTLRIQHPSFIFNKNQKIFQDKLFFIIQMTWSQIIKLHKPQSLNNYVDGFYVFWDRWWMATVMGYEFQKDCPPEYNIKDWRSIFKI